MPSHESITAIVSGVLKDSPLPADYRDADAQTQRRVEREAEAQGVTPEAYWSAIKAQAEKDAAGNTDAEAIAKAARR